MDDSPLARLPPELRNSIYELCFTQETIIHVSHHVRDSKLSLRASLLRRYFFPDSASSGISSLTTIPLPAHAFALAQTCTRVQEEGAKLFYSCNKFQIPLRGAEIHELSTDITDEHCGLDYTGAEYRDIIAEGESDNTAQRIEQALAPWHLFVDSMGKEKANALQSVDINFGLLHRHELTETSLEKVVTGIMIKLTNERAGMKDLRLIADLWVGTSGSLIRIRVDLSQTTTSLSSIADEAERKAGDASCNDFKPVEFMEVAEYVRRWEKEVRAATEGVVVEDMVKEGTGDAAR